MSVIIAIGISIGTSLRIVRVRCIIMIMNIIIIDNVMLLAFLPLAGLGGAALLELLQELFVCSLSVKHLFVCCIMCVVCL